MDIKQAFLDWTKHTVPYKKEDEYLKDLLPSYLRKDSSGNYYYIVGESDTMFTAHLDTVGGDVAITHVIEHGTIKTDGKSILGADDKAGVVILLYMIEKNVPGFYLFPVGEEVGCVGSGKLSKVLQDNSKKQKIQIIDKKTKQPKEIEISLPKDKKYNKIRKVISFDRMGYTSIITHQMDQRCCSNEFGEILAGELNKHGFEYVLDDSGVYSDSAEFVDIYPECTNLSIGYFAQHTDNETQDIDFLQALAEACTKIDWDSLPIYRNPSEVEFVDNYYNYWGGRGSGKKYTDAYSTRHQYIYDDETDELPTSYMKQREKEVRIEYFYDEENDYICDVSYIGDKMVDINLADKRLGDEINMIEDLLNKFEVDYDDIFWDGLVLVIEAQKNETKMTRNELLQWLPELSLDNIPGYDQKEEEEIVETS
jgi:hypothetical protein